MKKLSTGGKPEHLAPSQLPWKRRKTSLGQLDGTRKYSNALQGNDLLLDPLSVTQPVNIGGHPQSAIDNVRRMFSANEEAESPQIFSEMLSLRKGERGHSWKQLSRWIKYEQVVEGNGTRFSKPHITLLSVQALLQLKNCLKKGVVILDSVADRTDLIADEIVHHWHDRGLVPTGNIATIKKILCSTKRHLATSGQPMNDGDENWTPSESDEKIEFVDKEVNENDQDSSFGSQIIQANKRLMNKLPSDTESCSILVGVTDCVERPVSAFVRLHSAQNLYPELPDLPIPTRFVFVLLTPHENIERECVNIGRTMGAMMSDEIFRKVAQRTHEAHTLIDACEEFFSQIVAVPPGKCSTTTRWEPTDAQTQETRCIGTTYSTFEDDDKEPAHGSDITRTGKLFGGLMNDIRQKGPWFVSDFTDFFRGRISQSLAATVFLFFANITSIITFGAVMERALHHQMAAMESILCGGISGVLFAMFSGQPLNILSVTGPTLVFETILFDFCRSNNWDFLPFRVWVGIWIAVILIILTATDASALVGLITRFTEDGFATLISVVFIIQSFGKLIEISNEAPITTNPQAVYDSPCFCHLEQMLPGENYTVKMKLRNVTAQDCKIRGGDPVGLQCFFKPDVYMLSILLTFGTFLLAYGFSQFRKSSFFPSTIRNCISDFCVLISIVVMTLVSMYVGLEVPSLNVPSVFKPTLDRNWLVDPTHISPVAALIAIIPAAFYTILIVMDQQITAVIINRKDNKLRKGHGYHLDLLVIAILVLICSFLGLPYFVAATVLSVMHVDALRLQSESSAPGEKPQFLGVKEQRLTAIIAHLLIGLSVFLTPIIKLVPLPVLIGVFLYMGVVSLLGQQFIQRIAIMFMPVKHQPDYSWLRCVGMKRVHLFTIIQILSILGLFAVKYTKSISMVFPLMLIVTVAIRMFLLERIFTRNELLALDDPVPSFSEVMRPANAVNPLKLEKVNTHDQKLLVESA